MSVSSSGGKPFANFLREVIGLGVRVGFLHHFRQIHVADFPASQNDIGLLPAAIDLVMVDLVRPVFPDGIERFRRQFTRNDRRAANPAGH